MAQPQLLILLSFWRLEKAREPVQVRIKPLTDFCIRDLFSLTGPGSIKNMFYFYNPGVHALDRSQQRLFLLVQAHNGLEAGQTLLARLVYRSPPFSSLSKLASILLNAACVANPPY